MARLATAKASRLVRAAVNRARHLVPLDQRRIPIHPAALVIGGGVAGLMAARDLADRGMKVTLIEKRPFLGGRMAQLWNVFPTGEEARPMLCELVHDVVKHPLVTILTGAHVVDSEGVVGDFKTKILVDPRGVDERLTYPGNAIAACPEETISEFDFALSRRKAIYMPYPGCYPPIPAIDWHTCTKCGKCVAAVGGKGINLNAQPRELTLHSGVIVLATGYDPYEPLLGEYGYGIFPKVITLQQLHRMLDPEGPTAGALPFDSQKPVRIGFLHCVGARQIEGVNAPQPDGKVKDYCARTCCTAAMHAAVAIKERFPNAQITSFYQDMRTYGRGHEEYYEKASEKGVLFVRYSPRHPPRVDKDRSGQWPVVVRTKDLLTDGLAIEVPLDLLVLATGVVPHDISELVTMYSCAVGYDSFLLEVHPKLRPVELAVSGVFLAGCCQGPMDITEACSAASAAASKAAAMILAGPGRDGPVHRERGRGGLHRVRHLPDRVPVRRHHPRRGEGAGDGERGALHRVRHVRRHLPERGHPAGRVQRPPGARGAGGTARRVSARRLAALGFRLSALGSRRSALARCHACSAHEPRAQSRGPAAGSSGGRRQSTMIDTETS